MEYSHINQHTQKVLKHFYMDEDHPLSTKMMVPSLDVKKDPFHLKEDGEVILGHEAPYISAIGAHMYLTNCTQPDITFSIITLTRMHWNGKHVLHSLWND